MCAWTSSFLNVIVLLFFNRRTLLTHGNATLFSFLFYIKSTQTCTQIYNFCFMKDQKGCCTSADRHSADIKRTIWCCDTAWRAVVQFGAVTHPHH